MGKILLREHCFKFISFDFLFRRLQGILTRKDIIRLMREANVSKKFED